MKSTIYGDGKFHYNARTGEYRKVLKRNLKEIRLPSGAVCYEVKYSLHNLKTQKRYSTLEEAEQFMTMCQNLLDKERLSRHSEVGGEAILEYPETLLRDLGIADSVEGYYEFIVPEFEERFERASEMLTPREKQTVLWYYRDMKNLEQVGNGLGVTRERARQIIAKAMRKLQHPTRVKEFTMPKDKYYLISNEEKEKMIAEFKAKLEQDYSEMTYEKALEIVKAHEEACKVDYSEMDVIELDLSVRSVNCLRHAGIITVGQLSKLSREKLLMVRNLGKKSAREIEQKLYEKCKIELKEKEEK